MGYERDAAQWALGLKASDTHTHLTSKVKLFLDDPAPPPGKGSGAVSGGERAGLVAGALIGYPMVVAAWGSAILLRSDTAVCCSRRRVGVQIGPRPPTRRAWGYLHESLFHMQNW